MFLVSVEGVGFRLGNRSTGCFAGSSLCSCLRFCVFSAGVVARRGGDRNMSIPMVRAIPSWLCQANLAAATLSR